MHQSCMHAHAYTARREQISSSTTTHPIPQDQKLNTYDRNTAGRRSPAVVRPHPCGGTAARPLADPAGMRKTAVPLLHRPRDPRRMHAPDAADVSAVRAPVGPEQRRPLPSLLFSPSGIASVIGCPRASLAAHTTTKAPNMMYTHRPAPANAPPWTRAHGRSATAMHTAACGQHGAPTVLPGLGGRCRTGAVRHTPSQPLDPPAYTVRAQGAHAAV